MIVIKSVLNRFKIASLKYFNEIDPVNSFLLFLLVIITIYPLFSVGFTNHDDVFIAISTWSGHIWDITKIMSMGQGRFAFFWAIPLSSVPFIFDNHAWYLIIKFGSFIFLLFSLHYAVLKLFRSSWIALVSVTFFLAIIQNGWEYNALTSYPLVFNFYAILFLVSIGLFSSAVDQENLILAYFGGFLYFFTLGVELFVLFFPFYFAILLSRFKSGVSLVTQFKLNKKYIVAILGPLMLYLIVYFIWRYIFPSNYDGNKIGGSNLMVIVKIITTYSLSAFPLASLHFYPAIGDPITFSSSVDLRVILSKLSIIDLIKPIVVGFIFIRIMTTTNLVFLKTRTLIIGASLAFIGIFLPNLLLGLSLKYQSLVDSGAHSFVYTYYSFIFVVVFLALLLACIKKMMQSWHYALRVFFVSSFVSFMIFLSLAVELRNQCLAFDQKLAERKWQLMDEFIGSSVFEDIHDDAVISAPTLISNFRGIAVVNPDDWSSYVKYKTGKNIKFTDAKCEDNSRDCYNLLFRQESNSDSQFIVFERNKNFKSSKIAELTIYYNSSQSDAFIMGSFVNHQVNSKVEINGEIARIVGSNFSSRFLTVSGNSDNYNVQIVKIKGNVDFIPESITTSRFNIEPYAQ